MSTLKRPDLKLPSVPRPQVVLPLGAACVAVIAAGMPTASESEPVESAQPVSANPSPTAAMAAASIGQVSVENVADFVAVRVHHQGGYWDGRTDVKIGVDGASAYPYRVRVSRGDSAISLRRTGGRAWKCADARANAGDSSDQTLIVLPRSCFDSAAEKVRASAVSYSGGQKISSGRKGYVERTKQPNIVMIMSDDMRDDEYDGPWMKRTQRLIGDAGVRFDNSFAPLPLCAPARASFLTGQYSHNHGVWSHRQPYGFSVFRDQETLPVWLNRGGYHTFMLGKYINGYGKSDRVAPNGKPSTRYVPPGWDDWRASLDGQGTYHYRKTHLNNNGKVQSLRGSYQTRAYGRIASNVLKQRSKRPNKPYFAYLSYTAPHHGAPVESDDPKAVIDLNGEEYRIKTPAVPKRQGDRWDADVPRAPGAGGESDMSDKPDFMQRLPGMSESEQEGVRELARQRAESLGVLDRSVARVMRTLRQRGELDNTYVMFTSDNGYFLGEHRMRQGKTLPYEPSLRTPTVMRGPGIPASQSRTDPFLSIDFAPTMLRMAGLSTSQQPPVDGRSMLDIAERGDRGWSRPVVTETGPSTVPTLMDLSGDTVGKDPNDSSRANRIKGLRTPEYLFTETSGREPELYDLESDPGQVRSVIGDSDFEATHERLNKELEQLQSCVGDQCRTPMPRQFRADSDRGADSGDGPKSSQDGDSNSTKDGSDGDSKSEKSDSNKTDDARKDTSGAKQRSERDVNRKQR